MKLTVLGSTAGCPAPGNPGSGYLVEAGSSRVWVDCGPGTFAALSRLGDPASLDAVILSHTHVDHSTDLLGLFAYLAYGLGGRVSVPVFAPEGAGAHLAAYARADDGHVFHDVLEFVEVGHGSESAVDGLTLRFGEAVHPVPALVVRLEDRSGAIAYSGDTGPGGDLIEIATGVDLLVCEAGLQGVRGDDSYPFHLTAREAGEIAAMCGANVLAVTHVPFGADPQLAVDQASSAFAGSVEYAAPGSTFSTE